MMIINFIFLPVTMFLLTAFLFSVAAFFAVAGIAEGCCKITKYSFDQANCCKKMMIILLFFLLLCIFEPIALGVAAALTALAIVPAYIFQIYKIFKIILLWGFKSNDQKKQPP